MAIFGNLFDMRSKDEKERDYKAYSKRIFPYGDVHKDKVSAILSELFPNLNQKYLRMYYILIKEGMTEEDPFDFETAAGHVVKKSLVKVTPELKAGVHALLDADLAIDKTLDYPTLDELRTATNKYL